MMELPRLQYNNQCATVIQLIKSCGKKKDISSIRRMQYDKPWLIDNTLIANTLIRSYAKCGALKEAQHVFDQMAVHDAVSWNALIAGYAEQGFAEGALTCFKEMENDGVKPDSVTYSSTLKACAMLQLPDIVKQIHSQVNKKGLLNEHIVLGTSLVNAYVKCGVVTKAREVFEQLQHQDVVSWNALIAGYAEQGFGEEALTCLREIENGGVAPDSVTYACSLKACALVGAIKIVKEIHVKVREQGLLNKNITLGTALVSAYTKCGTVKKAQEVFYQLVARDVVSWNALISGYVEQGFGDDALKCYKEMKNDGVKPDLVTYCSCLKACAIARDLETLKEIHEQVRKQGLLSKHIVLGSALVNAYAKCASLKEARDVFDQLIEPNGMSWNALIDGYAEQGFGEEALACFSEMKNNKVVLDSVTYACTLKACATVGAVDTVRKIHAQVVEQKLLDKDIVLGISLVNAYAKSGSVKEAHEVFEQLLERNVQSWNALIAGYADQGYGEEALRCFREMERDNITPDSLTYSSSLKACAIVRDLDIVKEIHADVRENGMLNKHIVLGTALVTAYAKCGAVKEAREVFDVLRKRDVVSWCAIIDGYTEQGFGEEALGCFKDMEKSGVATDSVTYACALKACSVVKDYEIVKEIHFQVREQGLLNKDILLGNSLVNAYAKCGGLKEALEVFDWLPQRNAVSWNAIISGYVEHGLAEDALTCFRNMGNQGVKPDVVTYICSLTACGFVADVALLTEIHDQIRDQELLNKHIVLGTALVNGYAKCGAVKEAREVFDQLPERNTVSWNAVLDGYGQLGWLKEMLKLFNRMMGECIFPDSVTFVTLLNCCSHGALLEEGERLFTTIGIHSLAPAPEHHACMVDLFGRAGQIDKAKYFVLDSSSPTLLAFLGACQKWVDVDFGQWAFEKLLQLDPSSPNVYVSMANIYAAADMMKEAHEIEVFRVKRFNE